MIFGPLGVYINLDDDIATQAAIDGGSEYSQEEIQL
ncbi:hypothetical protein ABIB28_000370 [Sphingomonas sp. UYEF23]